MVLTFTQTVLAIASGSVVGFSLGLVGGGGSILAVPLLVYVVGLDNPHIAIGTSAIAVALNAASNLAMHARSGNVKWFWFQVKTLWQARNLAKVEFWQDWIRENARDKDSSKRCHYDREREPRASHAPPAAAFGIMEDGRIRRSQSKLR